MKDKKNYFRIIHRYLGFYLAGIMAVYSISGVSLIFRKTDAFKKAEASAKARSSKIKFKNISGKGGGGSMKMPQEYAKPSLFRKN